MRTFELTIKGRTYQVEIGELSQSPVEVTVNRQNYSVQVTKVDSPERTTRIAAEPSVSVSPKATAPSIPRQTPQDQPTSSDGVEVTAPMPGKILSIKVSVGDHVEVGQILCTLEAMKMEMAINSVSSGTVTKISVETGQTVNHGETLCIIA
ncbi:MAG: biotin/lipoyl-containing protein [Chloroflexota bacterium]